LPFQPAIGVLKGATMSSAKPSASIITKGFWLAGAYNVLGVLFFSKLFTNTLLSSLDPAVFSWLGLLAIVLWGLAYASVANAYPSVPYLVLVFFVEKMVYTVTWLAWLVRNGDALPSLYSESPLTAVFFSIYGAGDLAFGLFFLWVAIHVFSGRNAA
jgi:hypothetical protein